MHYVFQSPYGLNAGLENQEYGSRDPSVSVIALLGQKQDLIFQIPCIWNQVSGNIIQNYFN
jgi:predicted RNase H-like nuclease